MTDDPAFQRNLVGTLFLFFLLGGCIRPVHRVSPDVLENDVLQNDVLQTDATERVELDASDQVSPPTDTLPPEASIDGGVETGTDAVVETSAEETGISDATPEGGNARCFTWTLRSSDPDTTTAPTYVPTTAGGLPATSLYCPLGMVAVGIEGSTESTERVFGAVRLRCARLRSDGRLAPSLASTGPFGAGGPFVGPPTPSIALCPEQSVLVGLRVYSGPNATHRNAITVSGVGLLCRALTREGTLASVVEPATMVGTRGTNPPTAALCDGGRVLIGLGGRVGATLDGLGGRCAQVTMDPTACAPLVSLDCPSGTMCDTAASWTQSSPSFCTWSASESFAPVPLNLRYQQSNPITLPALPAAARRVRIQVRLQQVGTCPAANPTDEGLVRIRCATESSVTSRGPVSIVHDSDFSRTSLTLDCPATTNQSLDVFSDSMTFATTYSSCMRTIEVLNVSGTVPVGACEAAR